MTSSEPALSPPNLPSASPPLPGAPPAPRILLVVGEDVSSVGIIRRAFERESELTLVVVPSLAEARAAIKDRPPAIVVADAVLPDGQGKELAGPLEGREFPVILLAGSAEGGTAIESPEGAIERVEKTAAGLIDLPNVVRRILSDWKLRRPGGSSESTLKGSESRIRAILDAIPDLILIHDGDGRVLECEGGSGTELGERRAELIGRELSQVVVPLCSLRLKETIRAVCSDGKTRTALYEMESHRVFDSKLVRYEEMKVLAILRDITDRHQASAQLARLSPREHDVLSLIVEGTTNKAIGLRLGIGIKTVETHRANIMKKLKARTVAELLRLAFAAERH